MVRKRKKKGGRGKANAPHHLTMNDSSLPEWDFLHLKNFTWTFFLIKYVSDPKFSFSILTSVTPIHFISLICMFSKWTELTL